ncbi:Intraflagellar transport protein [Echinococcus granulosus]|uniref:Intraflagellar transport protein n=2 Tax=Echinococcus granulosus TaxID=6210 RepID=W6U9G9_ECHGR|nr:Intraflagellar transport protein [Echinococcus granulosus]EUB58013.1 Intraflagellar transport protein [Echinococcus granulosus]
MHCGVYTNQIPQPSFVSGESHELEGDSSISIAVSWSTLDHQTSLAMRPSTSKLPPTGQPLPVGTATRLTTGLRQRLTTAAAAGSSSGTSALNTELSIEDRPITAQGLKTAPKGPQRWRRQVEDRAYFIGVLRGHINAITGELNIIVAQHEEAEKEAQSFVQYEKMAEALAAELRALQGELGDYNTLVDKATLGHDISTIELDWEDVKAANERAEMTLERFFEERKKKEAQLKALELEIEQEKKIAESVVEEMNDEQKAAYLKLRDFNDHLLQQLTIGQNKIAQMSARRSELETDISTSKIKQEAMRILGQLREVEAKRDQLQAEEANKEDPQAERERLLAKVKEDNRETANMDREIRELNEMICSDESTLHQLTTQLKDDSSNERTQKIWELQRREAQIEAFLTSYETARAEEVEGLASTEDQIVRALERCAQYVVSTEQTMEMRSSGGGNGVEAVADQLKFKTREMSKSANTAEALDAERTRLQRDLQKIDQLEGKITQELQTLKKNIASMEADLKKFNDLTSVGEATEEKKASLMQEQEHLRETRENLATLTTQLTDACTAVEVQLNAQETHLQLCSLEKRLVASEQTRRALAESVAKKRAACDFAPATKKAQGLLKDYNEALKAALKVKPVGI